MISMLKTTYLLTLAGLLAMVSLLGCSSTPVVTVAVPSATWTAPCPEPILSLETNGDMAKTVLALRLALKECNDDKASLREWVELSQKP